MKQKPLKLITLAVVVSVGVILFTGKKPHQKPEAAQSNVNNINEAMASQFNDTVRAVSARVDENDKALNVLNKKNEALERQNQLLSKALARKDKAKSSGISSDLVAEITSLKGQVQALESRKGQQIDKPSYPLNTTAREPVKPVQYVIDIDEQQARQFPSKTESTYWEKLAARRKHASSSTSVTSQKSKDKNKGIPYYTVPAGSDLGGTTLLSALIGEVPNDNKFSQPLFPFSAIISRGSLMSANGVPLPPDIKGMKVGGYSIGVGSFLDNISCTRAYVTSALFVFQDGHFETIGKESMKSAADLIDNQAIGYLTNVYGNPCIRGTYYTNAPQVLGIMTGVNVTGGLGAGLANSQTSYSVSGGGIASAPTGSTAKIMLGSAASEGLKETSAWLKERLKGSFDMVFVPASVPFKVGNQLHYRPTRLTLHITKTLEINKDTQGRRLSYGQSQTYINDYSLK